MSAPYDPRAAALDALAAMRWPDVSEPPVEQVEAMEAVFRAYYAVGVARVRQRAMPVDEYDAYCAGRDGRPLVPPK